MTKTKKDLIVWTIWLIVGVLFATGGGIMTSITKGNQIVWIVCGAIMAACGLAIIILSIIKLVKIKNGTHNKKAR